MTPSTMIITSATTAPLPLIALFLASVVLLAASAAAPPQPPPQSSCTEELVLFSPCLPYISSPPNNLSATPSDICCHAFSSALNSSSNGVCLCYLVQQPSILGFPVSGTKVLSLPSVCPLTRNGSSTKEGSLGSICSGSAALPPLRSPTSSELTHPSGSGFNNFASPPEPEKNSSATSSSSPEFAKTPPKTGNSSVEPATVSSAIKQVYSTNSWFPPGTLIFFVSISTHLCLYTL